MAGKNHHHIWQLLQRGFGEKLHGDHHIWVYEKGRPPYRTVTRKHGAVKKFYGPEGSNADTNITNFENSTQSYIQDARKASHGSKLDSKIVATIITSLEMRSLFLRQQLSNVGKRLVSTLGNYLASEKHANQLFSAYLKNHPELIEEMLDEMGVLGEERRKTKIFIEEMLPNIISQGAKEASLHAKMILGPIVERIATTAKNAHIKSLETSFTKIDRIHMHLEREYFIHHASGFNFVLPDTNLAFLTSKGANPFSQKDDQIEQVVLPISSETIIIGKVQGSTNRSNLTLNRILATCSFESFIANENNSDLAKMQKRIGRNAKVISDSEIKKILSFNELLKL